MYQVYFGVAIWATGVGALPLTRTLAAKLKQANVRALSTNGHLQLVQGSARANAKARAEGSVCVATGMHVVDGAYAIGDCATVVQTALRDRIVELWHEADKNGNGALDINELNALLRAIEKDFPLASGFVSKGQGLLSQFGHDGTLTKQEFEKMMMHIDSKRRALPGTAQVAKQQAIYLAHEMNEEARAHGASAGRPAFDFKLQGEMAYVGKNVSVAGLGEEGSFVIGDAYLTNLMWRAAYWWMLPDLRSMAAVPTDWLKTVVFGRDSSCWEHARIGTGPLAPPAPAPAPAPAASEARPGTGDVGQGRPDSGTADSHGDVRAEAAAKPATSAAASPGPA